MPIKAIKFEIESSQTQSVLRTPKGHVGKEKTELSKFTFTFDFDHPI